MNGMKLSEKLIQWRAGRPDEWKMDEFIRLAKELESECYTHRYNDTGIKKECTLLVSTPDSNGNIVVENKFNEYLIASFLEVYKK